MYLKKINKKNLMYFCLSNSYRSLCYLARNCILSLLADVPTAAAEEEEEAPATKEPSKRVAVEAS